MCGLDLLSAQLGNWGQEILTTNRITFVKNDQFET